MGRIAEEIGINDFLYLSRGESKDTGKARQAILANALEAIIGAIYLDAGYETARVFIDNFMLVELPEIIENKLYRDSKSLFQEASQEKAGITPNYQVLSESGPDHSKIFRVGVYLRKELVTEGEGSSKQEAEQSAAENALKVKNWQ
jgi:ribonuclease-3